MSSFDKLSTLRDAGLLSTFDDAALRTVAQITDERRYDAEDVVVAQGEPGNAYFVIALGRARVTVGTAQGKELALCELGPGDGFGEIALIDEANRRTATVTALEPLRTLRIPARAFRELIRSHPEFREGVEAGVERFLREGILARSAEFGVLGPEQRRWLAERVKVKEFAASELLMREGEAGDRCYLVAEGRVEILRGQADGSERQVDTAGPGTLLGEAALLTDAPRTASVRALERCRTLSLDRSVLLQALGEHELCGRLIELLNHRAWPRQLPGVEVFEYLNPDGDTVSILRDAEHRTYHRLAAEGRFVWNRLDGHHNMKDLSLAFMRRFGVFAPERIGRLVLRLARRGLIDSSSVSFDPHTPTSGGSASLFARAQALARWTRGVSGLEPWVSRLYASGARHLLGRPGLAFLGFVTILGIAVSGTHLIPAANHQLAVPVSGSLLLAFVPLLLLSILFHEAGHALTVKHHGRVVDRGGIGLYFLIPVLYVDTSDMWVAGRWPRIAVSLAGPAASALCGSISALAASYVAWSEASTVVLWQLAIVSYAMAIANLNPLLELDGYHVLSDYLDRPNLRGDALRSIGGLFDLRRKEGVSRKPALVDLGYGLVAVLFLLFLCGVILLVHRLFLEGWLSRVLSPGASTTIAWAVVVAAVAVNLLALLGELRGDRSD